MNETEQRATASDIPVWCSHSKLEDIANLVPNPRNPNKHPDNQIALLAKIIRHQGWRNPIVVSDRSGFIVKGHARFQAARVLQVEQVPVDVQHYENEAMEYADLIADNRIAELAEPDMTEIKDLLQELDTGAFDMDITGFDKIILEQMMTAAPPPTFDSEWKGMPSFSNEPDAVKSIVVHFDSLENVHRFAEFVQQEISDTTKSIWYPKRDKKQLKGQAFVSEQGQE